MKVVEILIILLSLCLPFMVDSLAISINEYKGRNTRECLIGLTPCATLEFVVHNLQVRQNVSIFLSSPKVTLSTVVNFIGWKGLKIYGQHYHNNNTITMIECKQYKGHLKGHSKGHSNGLFFNQSKDINLYKFKLNRCSFKTKFIHTKSIYFRAGLVIQNSTNIILNHSQVTESNGYGVVFMNNNGNNVISHSTFSNNAVSGQYMYKIHGGAGMLILSTKCSLNASQCNNITGKLTSSSYDIKHVQFTNNIHTTTGQDMRNSHNRNNCQWFLCYGGGLSIYLGWATSGHSIKLYKAMFSNNTAPEGGGGLSVTIINKAYFNKISILYSKFALNTAGRQGGGGGVKVSLLAGRYTEMNVLFNLIEFQNCFFMKNVAKYGGGTSLIIASTDTYIEQYRKIKSIIFRNCVWFLNMAKTGGAVDVTRQPSQHAGNTFVTKPVFINCTFSCNNRLDLVDMTINKGGTFQITKTKVHFKGYNIFAHNHATPLYLRSASILFKNNTKMQFSYNKGQMGGAMAFFDNSYIEYKGKATFNFTGNRASVKGGAIYASISDPHTTQSCFIKAFSNTYISNASFHFTSNKHEGFHLNSIYLTTIRSCASVCNHDDNTSATPPFSPFQNGSENCLGKFYFYENFVRQQVMTDVARIDSKNTTKIDLIPGKYTPMPLDFYDDFNIKVTQFTAYYVDFQTDKSRYTFSQGKPHLQLLNTIVSNNHITVFGAPGKRGILQLSTQGIRTNLLHLNYEILSCPPGYVLDGRNSCHCSATMGRGYWYTGILGCNDTSYSVFIQPGYWIGYVGDGSANKEDLLYTGLCPPGYCGGIPPITKGRYYQIYSDASINQLAKVMCNNNRRGLLCSQCVPGKSVYFHTYTLKCLQETSLCSYGILFYVLSEWVPITVFFGICIYYNISFISGAAYSIVFFIQQLNILLMYHKNSLNDDHQTYKAMRIIRWFYSLFNLKFLVNRKLSFCLWKGAGSMDVKVMNYISICYAICLVYVLVYVMKRCRCCLVRKRQSSLVHGLSTFLVLCYSRITQVTFNILEFQIIRGKGNVAYPSTVAYWDGQMTYFQGRHLYYALPALVFLFLIVVPTPLFLTCDPLLLQLEGRLRVKSRYRFWTKFRERFKPLLDSFQSCFKDKYRNFAGIYFLYRMTIIICLVVSGHYVDYYFVKEIILIFMLVVQSLLQPFELKRHNFIASLSFAGLLIINLITIRINAIISLHGSIDYEAQTLQLIQVVILYIPLLVGFVWGGLFLIKGIRKKKIPFLNKGTVGEFCHQRSYSEISLIFDRKLEETNSYESEKRRNMYM